MDGLPQVARFNAWGEWKPLLHRGGVDDVVRVRNMLRGLSPAVAAVVEYVKATGSECIEFVVVARLQDPKPVHRLSDGILLVATDAVTHPGPLDAYARDAGRGFGRQYEERLYDGWMPLDGTAVDDIVSALERIEQTVAVLGYVYDTHTKVIVKYIETQRSEARHVRRLGEADERALLEVLGRARTLPRPLQSAWFRAIHWFQSAREHTNDPVSEFLSRYYAFETLALALAEHAQDVGLPVALPFRQGSRNQRREQRSAAIRELLTAYDSDLSEGIKRAYFDVITPIGRTIRAVNDAVFGDSLPANAWMFEGSDGSRPITKLRSDIVHGHFSGLDKAGEAEVLRASGRLHELVRHLASRVSRRLWRGEPLPSRPMEYSMNIPMDQELFVEGGTVTVSGDFRLDWPLLLRKGVL